MSQNHVECKHSWTFRSSIYYIDEIWRYEGVNFVFVCECGSWTRVGYTYAEE